MRPRQRRRHAVPRKSSGLIPAALLFAAVTVGVAFNLDDLVSGLRQASWGPKTLGPEASYQDGRALRGQVSHVRDGDTVEVAGIPVRIANLDCDERGTASGERAMVRMRQLASTGPFACRLEGRMSYDRQVGVCALSDG